MKKKLKLICVVLSCIVCAGFTNLPAHAASAYILAESASQTIYSHKEILEDGSYSIDEIQVVSSEPFGIRPAAATNSKSATRTYTYYNNFNKKCWTFTLKGTFQYNGSSARATAASTSYSTYVTGWKCSSRNAAYSGNTATGNATFKYLTRSVSVKIGLRCSASGTISNVNY